MTRFKKLLILLIFVLSQLPIKAETATIATIKDFKLPLEEIKLEFENNYPRDNIILVYDNKVNIINLLKKTNSNIDLIILDNKRSIDYLTKSGYLDKNTIKILGKDKLCVVVQKNKDMRAFFLYPKTMIFKSIAVGNSNLTSLGEYTKEALIKLNLWSKLPSKLVYFETNQQIADNVSAGFYDGGIMYYSFAKKLHVKVSDIFNTSLYTPIYYVSAARKTMRVNTALNKFNVFLGSKPAKKIFNKYNILNN